MPIRFLCPSCGQRYEVPTIAAGKLTECKKCGESVRVPEHAGDDPIELREIEDATKTRREVRRDTRNGGSNYSKASLWCGISSILCAPVGILAIVFGIVALCAKGETGKQSDAVAGLCLGAFGWIVPYALFFFLLSATNP